MKTESGLVMRPLLMCEKGHTADVPDVRHASGVSGPVECAECWEPMFLITFGIVDPKPMWGDYLGDTARRRASGTWWR